MTEPGKTTCPECGMLEGHDEVSQPKTVAVVGCGLAAASIFILTEWLLAFAVLLWISAAILALKGGGTMLSCSACDHTWTPGSE